MGAHMVGRLNVLRIDAMFGFALDVFNLKWRILRPKGEILVEWLRENVQFHFPPVKCISSLE